MKRGLDSVTAESPTRDPLWLRHPTTDLIAARDRAALIYQHASEERDIQIAERLSAMTDEALGRSKNPVNADESSHIGRNG